MSSTSALTQKFRVGGWEAKFGYPQMSKDAIGDAAFLWEGTRWCFLGPPSVYVRSNFSEALDDCVSKIIKTQKGAKIFTKKGTSAAAPPEAVVEKTLLGKIFCVATAPTVTNVWIDVVQYRVFGFFGYHEDGNFVAVFNPQAIDVVNYSLTVIPASEVKTAITTPSSGNPVFDSAPAYSVEAMESIASSAEGEELKKVREELKKIKDHLSKIPTSEINDRAWFEGALEKLKSELEQKIKVITDPTTEQPIIHVTVENGRLKKVERRRSSVEKEKDRENVTTGTKFVVDAIEDAKNKMGIKDGIIPFPLVKEKVAEKRPSIINVKAVKRTKSDYGFDML